MRRQRDGSSYGARFGAEKTNDRRSAREARLYNRRREGERRTVDAWAKAASRDGHLR